MKYLFIDFDNEQFWIEIGKDSYATRQVIIDANGHSHASCLEFYLAEGYIDENELEGEIRSITQSEFEKVWREATIVVREKWDVQKKQYPIRKIVVGEVKYYYPQGWILDLGQQVGVCPCDLNLQPNMLLKGEVVGYDETNMWIIISSDAEVIG